MSNGKLEELANLGVAAKMLLEQELGYPAEMDVYDAVADLISKYRALKSASEGE